MNSSRRADRAAVGQVTAAAEVRDHRATWLRGSAHWTQAGGACQRRRGLCRQAPMAGYRGTRSRTCRHPQPIRLSASAASPAKSSTPRRPAPGASPARFPTLTADQSHRCCGPFLLALTDTTAEAARPTLVALDAPLLALHQARDRQRALGRITGRGQLSALVEFRPVPTSPSAAAAMNCPAGGDHKRLLEQFAEAGSGARLWRAAPCPRV
jgi:hypothetical protein